MIIRYCEACARREDEVRLYEYRDEKTKELFILCWGCCISLYGADLSNKDRMSAGNDCEFCRQQAYDAIVYSLRVCVSCLDQLAEKLKRTSEKTYSEFLAGLDKLRRQAAKPILAKQGKLPTKEQMLGLARDLDDDNRQWLEEIFKDTITPHNLVLELVKSVKRGQKRNRGNAPKHKIGNPKAQENRSGIQKIRKVAK